MADITNQLQAAAGAAGGTAIYNLYAWGSNVYGQLGTGNTTSYSSPVQIGATEWIAARPGLYATWAVKSDNTMWAMGFGSQLGTNTTTSYSSPVQIGALTDWSEKLGGGDQHCIAIKTDGTLWAWGVNSYGQLGLNDASSRSSPVQIGSATDWAFVSGGTSISSGAIKENGSLFVWGWNFFGQLGDNSTTTRSSPVQIGAADWAYADIGSSSFGIKTNGTLWAWGDATSGALGLNNTTSYSSPVQVGALSNWAMVSSQGNSTFAIKTDGTLWAWGNNNFGQLGLGDQNNRSSPVQVGALTDWATVSASFEVAQIAVKTDGTLWAWGNKDQNGTIGNNTVNRYSSPIQIGALTSWASAKVTTLVMALSL